MQNIFGICVQRMFWVTEFTNAEYSQKSVAMATKFKKNCTDCRYTEKYKNLRFITVTLIMLKNRKNQCKKLLSLKHISHAFETAKITVFYPTLCKTPDAPLQNELLY